MDPSKMSDDELLKAINASQESSPTDLKSMSDDELLKAIGPSGAAGQQSGFVPTEDKQPPRPALGRNLDAFYDEPFKRRDLGAEANQGVSNSVLGLPMSIGKDLNEGRYGPAALKTGLGVAGIVGAATIPGVAPVMGAAMAGYGLYNLATNPHPTENLTRTTEDLTGMGMAGAMMSSGPSVSPQARQMIGDAVAKGNPKFWRAGSPLREWAGNLFRPAAAPATGMSTTPPEVAPVPPSRAQLNELSAGERAAPGDAAPKTIEDLARETAPENSPREPVKVLPPTRQELAEAAAGPRAAPLDFEKSAAQLQREAPPSRSLTPNSLRKTSSDNWKSFTPDQATGPDPYALKTGINMETPPPPASVLQGNVGNPIPPPAPPAQPTGLEPIPPPGPAQPPAPPAPSILKQIPPQSIPAPSFPGAKETGLAPIAAAAEGPAAPQPPSVFKTGMGASPPSARVVSPVPTGLDAGPPLVAENPPPVAPPQSTGFPGANELPPPRPGYTSQTQGPASIARQMRGLVEPKRFRMDQLGAVQLLLNDLKMAQQSPNQTGTDVLREIPWHKGTSEKELAPPGVPQHIWDWIRASAAEATPKDSPAVMKDILRQMAARSSEGGR